MAGCGAGSDWLWYGSVTVGGGRDVAGSGRRVRVAGGGLGVAARVLARVRRRIVEVLGSGGGRTERRVGRHHYPLGREEGGRIDVLRQPAKTKQKP